MLFTVDLITYAGKYRTIETEKLNVPAIDGRRTILSNHMPIMIPLQIGVIETKKDNVLYHYAVSEGMLLFENNQATILCDEIIAVTDIDVERAKASLKKAQEKLGKADKEADIERARIAIARAVNLIDVQGKYVK